MFNARFKYSVTHVESKLGGRNSAPEAPLCQTYNLRVAYDMPTNHVSKLLWYSSIIYQRDRAYITMGGISRSASLTEEGVYKALFSAHHFSQLGPLNLLTSHVLESCYQISPNNSPHHPHPIGICYHLCSELIGRVDLLRQPLHVLQYIP